MRSYSHHYLRLQSAGLPELPARFLQRLLMTTTLIAAFAAAVLEISGCFAFWAWLRLDKSAWWLAPGIVSLMAFAVLLTRIEAAHAGRAFAAYGGIYIVCSLLWMIWIEGSRANRWDLAGAALCLAGAVVILMGSRSAS